MTTASDRMGRLRVPTRIGQVSPASIQSATSSQRSTTDSAWSSTSMSGDRWRRILSSSSVEAIRVPSLSAKA